MFGPPGRLYVYFSYGMHWCVNVVCGPEGVSEAVLLRAGEPLSGLDVMRSRRGDVRDERLLASGPGRLAQALGIDRRDDGALLLRGGRFWCSEDATTAELRAAGISRTTRIGLGTGRGDDLDWRFVISGHPHASRRA
jgi:DNA-3-methyladenine glycosylase